MLIRDIIKDIIYDDEISDENKIIQLKSLISDKEFPVEFEKFWKLYKTIGGNLGIPRKEAFKKFNILCRAGEKPNDIISGLNNYLEYCKVKKTEVQFIKKPRSFLNDKVYKLYQSSKKLQMGVYICSYGTEHIIGEKCNCY